MTIRQRWKQTALHNKLLVIIAALTLIALVVTPVVQTIRDEMRRREDRRPVVINNRPPELLQPVNCDTKTGLHSGNMLMFAKNIGKTEAAQVFPRFRMSVVPLTRTGIHIYDEPPPVDCTLKPTNPPMSFSLPPDREMQPQLRQRESTLSPINETALVQLYATSCFYYMDESQSNHAVCDTYILSLPSSNPLGKLFGESAFVCDGNPKIGKFGAAVTGHCAN